MATTPLSEPARLPAERGPGAAARAATKLAELLTEHSVAALRISLGLVIAGFGALKFIPGASPAEQLVTRTTEALTFGAVSGTAAVVLTAALETFLGLTLLTGRGLRIALFVMPAWLIGIMAPVALFPGDMFPDGFPSLTAQYVLKDVILAAAWAVLTAHLLGARFSRPIDDHRRRVHTATQRRNAS